MKAVRFLLAGDTSLTIEFGNEISVDINARVHAFHMALEQSKLPGIVETVPTYRSLTVHYRPETMGFEELVLRLKRLMREAETIKLPPGEVLEIPVLYGAEQGPDLVFVARHAKRSIEEVIDLHTSPTYLIYMLGFTPGFAYLGGLDPIIATPRLATPRVRIPCGSVGIAGEQTGVYPVDSPGGWQLIGRTPVKLYDPDRETPILLRAGGSIKFRAVDLMEYDAIEEQVRAKTYECSHKSRKED
ncbi:MAG: 5-oxoprolinase subunit PxpB [Oscillospiraceae bacterium]